MTQQEQTPRRPFLATQRASLPLLGVLLQCLDADRKPIHGAYASGFVRQEGGRHFLYTCWHVVVGFGSPHRVQVGLQLPHRRYLQLALQGCEPGEGFETVGGQQEIIIPLYDESTSPPTPLWYQDDAHVPHPDLNAVRIYVPFWHDVVKIELPPSLRLSALQVIDEARIVHGQMLPGCGDKCLVVGYPYGFSAGGLGQPTAVVLTRFIASNAIAGRRMELLLESIGAPGMSGGAVFVEHQENLLLFGVYTGSVFPDAPRSESHSKFTDLGVIVNLSLLLWGAVQMVQQPTTPHERDAS